MKKWQYIIIHHSLTKDTETKSWDAIKRYHIHDKGWSDIGYHYGIENINDKYEILTGRPINRNGGHTKGMNRKAIGICCVGNYDSHQPPKRMINLLIKLIKDLMKQFNISKENVMGHRDFCNYKSCPGKMFDLNKVRELL